eukprot:TRINITY_DN491_c0_g1_i1.p1 TRINITY_DN491_c0_g1~~TRINITY_DN491_c0_g1_i1.p1  ORF type:complete len:359 (+),score=107.36 TRINITY_DN491_c0_g1_i1:53-1129(+)
MGIGPSTLSASVDEVKNLTIQQDNDNADFKIDSLPSVIIEKILNCAVTSYNEERKMYIADYRDIIKVAGTCRYFFYHLFTTLETCDFTKVPQGGIKPTKLRIWTTVSDVLIERLQVRTNFLGPRENSTLRALAVHNIVTKNGSKYLDQFPNLTYLDLTHAELLSDEDVSGLSDLTQLKYLNMNNCANMNLKGFFIKRLEHTTNLETFLLGDCYGLTDYGMENFDILANCKKIKRLNFSDIDLLTDDAFKRVKNIKNLENINFRGCIELTDDAVKEIFQNLTKVKSLNLNDCIELTPDCLDYLTHLNDLEFFDIRNTNVDKSDIDEHWKNFKSDKDIEILVGDEHNQIDNNNNNNNNNE